ncbi:MAG: hypothetical protein AAGD00_06700 [Planctomycetota bacterium]
MSEHDAEKPVVDAKPARRRRADPLLPFAIATSLFAHLALAVIAALVVLPGEETGDPDGINELEVAVMTDVELTELLETTLTNPSPATQQMAEPEVFELEDFQSEVSDASLASLESTSLGDLGASGGEDAAAGAQFTSAAGGSARFFGVEARGSRFVYICDVSGSMVREQRMQRLRSELNASITDLLELAHFSIVFYSDGAYPLTGGRWVQASERFREEAARNIRAVEPSGGTNPVPAFQIVLDMTPLPDAIYFMTDGDFDEKVTAALTATIERAARSSRRRVPIHAITFGSDAEERYLRGIARRSGGSYTHIEGSSP